MSLRGGKAGISDVEGSLQVRCGGFSDVGFAIFYGLVDWLFETSASNSWTSPA